MLKNCITSTALFIFLLCGCQNNAQQKKQVSEDSVAGMAKNKMLKETKAFPTSGINDSINTKTSFMENTQGKNKLVLKYSRTNCWECVEDCMRVLKKFSDSTGFSKNHIIVISSDYQHRDFKLFHSNNLKDLAVYNLGEDIGLTIEKENYPYLFILDSGQVIRDIYLPVKHDDENTLHYLMTTLPKYSFKN